MSGARSSREIDPIKASAVQTLMEEVDMALDRAFGLIHDPYPSRGPEWLEKYKKYGRVKGEEDGK